MRFLGGLQALKPGCQPSCLSISERGKLSRRWSQEVVEIGGFEPPKPRLTARQGEPAIPTQGNYIKKIGFGKRAKPDIKCNL